MAHPLHSRLVVRCCHCLLTARLALSVTEFPAPVGLDSDEIGVVALVKLSAQSDPPTGRLNA